LEEVEDKEWTKNQNINIENDGREWGAQGEDMADEILNWKIKGVEEDNWSLGN
jgi:hypothetical protein